MWTATQMAAPSAGFSGYLHLVWDCEHHQVMLAYRFVSREPRGALWGLGIGS